MRVAFMGTPDFAVPCLDALHRSGVEVVLVVCQPDRPSGRGMALRPPPVKVAAERLGIPVMQPEKLIQPEFRSHVEGLGLDLVLVTAYGKILRKWFLDLPRLGCINIHASLLPRHRGAAPIHAAVLAGDPETGITIMKMDEGMDTGDMILQEAIAIGARENVGSVHDRLAQLGGHMVERLVAMAKEGEIRAVAQDGSLATYAPKLTPEMGEIRWESDAVSIDRQIRGLTPSPGSFTWVEANRVKILEAIALAGGRGAREPGSLASVSREGIDVVTGDGLLRILQFQWPGKKAMSVKDFLVGNDIPAGTRFSSRGASPSS